MDPGAAASILREKGEGASEIYFFQLLHLSQLSLSAFCGDSSVATAGQSQARRRRQRLPLPPLASRLVPALAMAGASSRCSTKAVAPLWERLCPKAKRYLTA